MQYTAKKKKKTFLKKENYPSHFGLANQDLLHRSIFELQERTLSSFLTCLIFGVYVLLVAPLAHPLYYLGSPSLLFFVYVVPIVPFVLVFDGLVSSVRTRTPDEVAALLRTCGADATGWELRSGRRRFLWPCGYMSWIICTKKR